MPLKYLFEAHFRDDSVVEQTQDDRSATVEGKNAFYDVLQRISEVQTLSLTDGEIIASVDLTSGLFSLNGFTFQAGDPSIPNLKNATGFRLIYFKRHRHHFSQDGTEQGHEIEYHIGWQTTIDGKNYQQTIAVT